MRGPPAQTANDSGVLGVAGGEAEAREKTGPSQRCSGRAGDSGCPPPAGGKQKIPEAQGRGGSWNSARPAHQNLRKGRVANNCFLWKKKKVLSSPITVLVLHVPLTKLLLEYPDFPDFICTNVLNLLKCQGRLEAGQFPDIEIFFILMQVVRYEASGTNILTIIFSKTHQASIHLWTSRFQHGCDDHAEAEI